MEQTETINCPRCLFDSSFATIGEKQCQYCDLHDTLEEMYNPKDFEPILEKIKSKKGKYNCLIGISGGLDSSVLLYAAVKYWNLKPLVIHFDNGWNAPEAESNMKQLIATLNVDSITYTVNKLEYLKLNTAFLNFGLPDADIPNDIAMTKLMYDTADKYGIKYILNGHDFRTEGSTPQGWTYMDAKYIQSVYSSFTGTELKNYPLFTFKDQIIYGLKGIKQVRPFYYINYRKNIEANMKHSITWNEYGGKHCENIYTEFVGADLLPNKFGIDKRIVYLSALIRSGELTKLKAQALFEIKPTFDRNKLGEHKALIEVYSSQERGNRADFDHYDFKKYRIIIWMLMKLKIVPYTFYTKYAC